MAPYISHAHISYNLKNERFFISQIPFFKIKKQLVLLLVFFCALAGALVNTSFGQTPSIQWQRAIGGTSDDVPQCIYQTKDGGYIIGGATGSKDGDISGNHGNGDLLVTKFKADGTTEWQKVLGGAGQEIGTLVQQTSDGGYIVGGTTFSSNGDVKGYHGGGDLWVVKISATGTIQWQQSLGGKGLDEMLSLQEVIVNNISNGFIVGGNTSSRDGDVTGNHGGKDVWVVKLSAAGIKQWQRALGSSGDETLNELSLAIDGGIIVGCRTSTNGGDVSGVHGSTDIWVVKMDGSGSVIWKRTLGGSGLENWVAVKPTTDGGYIVGTDTDSNDGDVTGISKIRGIWIAKLNATGVLSWQKKFDENGSSSFRDVRQTKDGGFIIGGNSSDNNTTTSGNNALSGQNIILLKLTAAGNVTWQKNYGGSEQEELYLLQQTNDNGYIIAATTSSPEINGYHSSTEGLKVDHWILKLDENGNKKWDRAFGGSGADWYWAGCCGATTLSGNVLFTSLLPSMKLQSSDGGYFFAVSSNSRDGDVKGLHYSVRLGVRADMWVVKLGPYGQTTLSSMAAPIQNDVLETFDAGRAFPNPFTTQTTIQFRAKETGRVSVEIFNMNGARIKTVYNSLVTAGKTYAIQLQDIKLAKGTYIYIINNNERRHSGRLIKN